MPRRSDTLSVALLALLAPADPAPAQPVEQWAQNSVGISSGTARTGISREALLGPADGACDLSGDEDRRAAAWRPGFPDRGTEWLEVSFATPVYATAIEVVATVNPGVVTAVLVRTPEADLHEVWTGSGPEGDCPATLRAEFEPLPFPTNRVRVELDTRLVSGFSYIDAVKLVGEPLPDFEPLFQPLAGDWQQEVPAGFQAHSAVDHDNDGWPDLLNRSWRQQEINALHNEGSGGLRLRRLFTRPPGLQVSGGPVYGDYDNDGDADMFVPLWAYAKDGEFSGRVDELFARNLLLRNDRGHFVDVAEATGLTDSLNSVCAIWLDVDRDGQLDLLVGHWSFPAELGIPVEGRDRVSNRLYRNRGDGTFEDATTAAGLDLDWHHPQSPFQGGTAFGFLGADLNDDGWTDLYVPNFLSANRLLLNDAGRFRDVTTPATGIVAQTTPAVSGDVDGDGDLDILSFSASAATPETESFRESSRLLLNLGGGRFLDATVGAGLGSLIAADARWGRLFDFDNDADLDLMAGTGLSSLFENRGDGTFVERSFQAGIAGLTLVADLDGDGFLDPVFDADVFHNRGNDSHFLTIDLVGVASNRDGYGARVSATTAGMTRMHELVSQDGWKQDDLRLHFGLGPHDRVDRLEVRWPSGQVDVIDAIPADQEIRVVEGRNAWYPAPRTVWTEAPPARVHAGESMRFIAAARPARFEPGARFTSASADLGALGGPQHVPLTAGDDGTFRLDHIFSVDASTDRAVVELLFLQDTSLGEHWISLSRTVEVEGPTAVADETGVAPVPGIPSLAQNYPNPGNPGTTISFDLPVASRVELVVYAVTGQRLATLVRGWRQAGSHSVSWQGHDDAGRPLASGIYLYRLTTNGSTLTRKLAILR